MLINWFKKLNTASKFLFAAFAFTWVAGILGDIGIVGLSISSALSAVICIVVAFALVIDSAA